MDQSKWKSPIPAQRWDGARRENKGVAAFESKANFEKALVSELNFSLDDHESVTLGRLLGRNNKMELEVFIRTHGPNPIFPPSDPLEIPVGVAKADRVSLSDPASVEANNAILDGLLVHVLFQAGEATRFQEGPFYQLNPLAVAKALLQKEDIEEKLLEQLSELVKLINEARSELPTDVGTLLADGWMGSLQPLFLRASLRRVIQTEINAGRIAARDAVDQYRAALQKQKILFFVSQRSQVNEAHDEMLRKKFNFFGFLPTNLVTIEQEQIHGVIADEQGKISLFEEPEAVDAGGHLYALIQACRAGDFTTYTESGRPIKPMEVDAFSYLLNRGARIINIIRINDMDRHTVEIINPKAVAYALKLFSEGYVNAIETVANPENQKGGTGTTFGDPSIHVLTETHENSFPALSRAFETGMAKYLEQNQGQPPAYNAMRQLSDLAATRSAIREYGGRIVFVPRVKEFNGVETPYLGVDMPMGDLSLLYGNYKSRMFQFVGPHGRDLLIHDMKKKENLPLALRAILNQLKDPAIVAVAEEVCTGKWVPFAKTNQESPLYGAPAPEFLK